MAGIEFEVHPSEYEEDHSLDLDPRQLVQYLAHGKAAEVARHYEDAIIIGGDTLAFLDDEPLGKPHTKERAKEMLRKISGKVHGLRTGFAVLDSGRKRSVVGQELIKVYVKDLSEEVIENYVETGEPLDRAGAYAIQGLGGALIEKIEGDIKAMIGLPVEAVLKIVDSFSN